MVKRFGSGTPERTTESKVFRGAPVIQQDTSQDINIQQRNELQSKLEQAQRELESIKRETLENNPPGQQIKSRQKSRQLQIQSAQVGARIEAIREALNNLGQGQSYSDFSKVESFIESRETEARNRQVSKIDEARQKRKTGTTRKPLSFGAVEGRKAAGLPVETIEIDGEEVSFLPLQKKITVSDQFQSSNILTEKDVQERREELKKLRQIQAADYGPSAFREIYSQPLKARVTTSEPSGQATAILNPDLPRQIRPNKVTLKEVQPVESRGGLYGFQDILLRKAEEARIQRITGRGTGLDQLTTQFIGGVPAGFLYSLSSTGTFAYELSTKPLVTSKQIITSIPQLPKIARESGQFLLQYPSFSGGFIAGEIGQLKFGSTIVREGTKGVGKVSYNILDNALNNPQKLSPIRFADKELLKIEQGIPRKTPFYREINVDDLLKQERLTKTLILESEITRIARGKGLKVLPETRIKLIKGIYSELEPKTPIKTPIKTITPTRVSLDLDLAKESLSRSIRNPQERIILKGNKLKFEDIPGVFEKKTKVPPRIIFEDKFYRTKFENILRKQKSKKLSTILRLEKRTLRKKGKQPITFSFTPEFKEKLKFESSLPKRFDIVPDKFVIKAKKKPEPLKISFTPEFKEQLLKETKRFDIVPDKKIQRAKGQQLLQKQKTKTKLFILDQQKPSQIQKISLNKFAKPKLILQQKPEVLQSLDLVTKQKTTQTLFYRQDFDYVVETKNLPKRRIVESPAQKQKVSLDFKGVEKTKLLPQQKTKTLLSQDFAQGNLSGAIVSDSTKQNFATASASKLKFSPATIQKFAQDFKQNQFFNQDFASKTRLTTKQITEQPKKPPIKIKFPRPRVEIKQSGGFFQVFGRRRGTFRPIGQARTAKGAAKIGATFARTTLGATFKVTGGDIGTPQGFYSKQTSQGKLFIEQPKFRLNTPTEVTALQQAKRRKKRRRK